ncbi:MAG TPA: hypothetical protein VJT85_03755 [Gemmatimonadaceae bacterium]|nr:hypothetical protein [Gemmatimonadaceae bacterium]
MNRIVLTAALAVALAPRTLPAQVAQARPDFSGTWALDASESRMIGPGGQSGPAQLGERRIAWRVDHRDPDIAVTITVHDPDRPHEFSFRCTTDGRTCVNELPELREVREMSARWSGAVLLMTQHARTPHGPFDAEDRLSLSDSGRTLVFDRIVRDERGQRSVRQLFRRVGSQQAR